MRPLALRLKGFTSFRDEQEIDFRELDLFALWGPTGSGKSSILDAITYALYGKVERVEGVRGESLTALITHGQPRMAVTLDFECHDKVFRITRTTSRTAPTKVRLERREGEDWLSYGEGADSVREVNRILPGLVGLDYDAFTRSVVLPQGKFAEFLVGDAAQRREILTELLGLELFGRMAQRSNEIARDAKSTVEANARVVEAEYAGIDEDAVAHAAAEATRLEDAARVASEAESALEQLEDEWAEQNDSIDALLDIKDEVEERRTALDTHAAALDRLAHELVTAEQAAKSARERVERLRAESERVAGERAAAEDRYGTLEDLARRKATVESLRALEREVKRAEKVAREQNDLRTAAEKAVATKDAAVAKADLELAAAQEELELREAEHERAHRADLVGALTHSLAPGDPCPVCDRPLGSLPEIEASELERANEVRVAAQQQVRSAQDAASAARVAQARASEALEIAVKRCAECTAEVEEKRTRLDEVRLGLVDQSGADHDDDPLALDARADALRRLIAAEKSAASEYAAATTAVASDQEALSKITTKIASVRGAVEGVPIKPLVVQVKRVLGRAVKVSVPTSLPDSPGQLAQAVRKTAKQLDSVIREVGDEVGARRDHAASLVQKARDALPPGVDLDGIDIKSMLAHVRGAGRALGQRAALAANEAKTVAEKLQKRRELESDIEKRRSEQAIYTQLHRELKNDRIVQFLQAEALGALAAAAGEHLKELSDDRYRLMFEDDRFYVIDAWNGDEQRSARTLSGGETFLASLGLALALSEQVQMLAVTERSRLESLFLDEGFGTLDANTLDIVVGAISRLGSDGRLVGVITHVPELADALPVRVEVLKGPRGSTIQRDDRLGMLGTL